MPSVITPDNSILASSSSGLALLAGDSLVVNPGIVISSPSNSGVYGMGGNTITCNGTIAGSSGISTTKTATPNIVNIGTTGTSSGTAIGLNLFGDSFAVNHGFVFGGAIGAAFYDAVAFNNEGAVQVGPRADGLKATVLLHSTHTFAVLTNNGLIENKYGGFAIRSDGSAVDIVKNGGRIVGDVGLGGGGDTFDTSKGRVVGTIDGGAGADKITGSAFVDTMKGGADADTFYFRTKPNKAAIDHIQDFVHGQDHIALSKSLFKLDPGQSVASAFQDITSGGFSKEGLHKHILYNHDTGFLYYDKDGKGGATPIHFATLDTDPSIGSSDILMV